MDQPLLFAPVPPVDPSQVSPSGQIGTIPPVAKGSHSSGTGALAVMPTWTARQAAYLRLMEHSAPLTDHEVAPRLKCGLSSVNSVRRALQKRGVAIVEDSLVPFTFTDFSGVERTTKRARWRLKR